MSPVPAARRPQGERNEPAPSSPRAGNLLARAGALMAERGYHHTSMRDVARVAKYSLAGLYHYFESKEELLFRIQESVFASLLAEQIASAARCKTPEEKLEILVRNHLAFFTEHVNELKLCTFELESLSGAAFRRIEDFRRRYYQLVADAVSGLLTRGRKAPSKAEVRHTTLLVFGMLNWLFMWFDPQKDAPVERLGDEIVGLVLHGLKGDRR